MNMNRTYNIRELKESDAEQLILYLEKIATESDNLTFGPGEFTPTVEEERAYIRSQIGNPNSLSLAAFVDDILVANLSFTAGVRKRTAHCGELGISVLKEYWRRGIASSLISELFFWAEENRITKINLKVKEDNTSAIALYKKLGFVQEGILTRDFLIDGRYYSSIAMGKIL
jgi:RimJ/RimL family protein N-acetyltransferase